VQQHHTGTGDDKSASDPFIHGDRHGIPPDRDGTQTSSLIDASSLNLS
jgi:hypothetical protein